MPEERKVMAIRWPGKVGVTYSDALTSVRCWIWEESVFQQVDSQGTLAKLPPEIRKLLLNAIASAP